jgi:DNA-binding response OmpR family regulator
MLEAKLLEFLLQTPDQVHTPDELFRGVWQAEPEAGDVANVARCAVKRLRRKLESDPGNPYQIVTIYGRGYRLVMKEDVAKDKPQAVVLCQPN